MNLAIQLATSDKFLIEETLQDLKAYKTQSFIKKAKIKGELVPMLSAKKGFDIMVDNIIEVPTEKNTLKFKKSEFD